MKNIINLSKKIILSLSLLFTLSMVLSSVNAETNITSSNNLGQTITNAPDGDTINLDSGTYTNNVTNITINKKITIIGKDPKNTMIDANKKGQMFNIGGTGSLTLINVTLFNGNATNGGTISNSGTLKLNNCIFTNNTGSSFGGAIYNTANNVTIENSKFINNSANYGGALHLNDNSDYFTINNCTFENNTSIHDGGAIENNGGGYLEIINSKFINNHAGKDGNGGGAIHNNGGDYFTIKNTIFTNNTSNGYYGGGAIVNSYLNKVGLPGGDYFKVINCTFENNEAKDSLAYGVGGAITNMYGHYSSIINSTFINNTADLYSGGIYNSNGLNFSVINSIFTNNKAIQYHGGAITNAAGVNFTITNSNFTNNSAGGHGGAILNDAASNMNVNFSKFDINKASSNGGAIYNVGNMSVLGNTMSGNVASFGQMIYNNGNMGILNLTYLNNNTISVDNNTNITLYATLTDDMGNTVTGQNISFYVNKIFIGNQTATEGYVNILFLVNHGLGTVPVTGDYSGHKGFEIDTKNGQLLIMNETIVNGTINLNKDEYLVDERVESIIKAINNGNDTAYNVTVKVNLPPEFILDKNSVIVSHGYYDPNTNIWYIGDLAIDEKATMNFTGIFTKSGTYTVDIITSGANFNNTTDSDNAIVTEIPIPSEPQKPSIPQEPKEPSEPQESNSNNQNNNNPTANGLMKETGIPINLILIAMLSVLGVLIGKKQKN